MHRPFSILDDLVKQGRIRLSKPAARKPEQRESGKLISRASDLSEGELFEQAMEDVRPLADNNAPPPARGPVEIRASDDEAEALKVLEEFCRSGRVDVELSREYVEHSSDPAGRLYLEGLRNGRFAIQAHLDLHGVTLGRARDAVDTFIEASVRGGHSCVRIVHGRGLHSPEKHSPLKENVQRWLRTRRLGRYIVAYTSARAVDGGGGAVYVLLRRRALSGFSDQRSAAKSQ